MGQPGQMLVGSGVQNPAGNWQRQEGGGHLATETYQKKNTIFCTIARQGNSMKSRKRKATFFRQRKTKVARERKRRAKVPGGRRQRPSLTNKRGSSFAMEECEKCPHSLEIEISACGRYVPVPSWLGSFDKRRKARYVSTLGQNCLVTSKQVGTGRNAVTTAKGPCFSRTLIREGKKHPSIAISACSEMGFFFFFFFEASFFNDTIFFFAFPFPFCLARDDQ